jgi:hypothetical protein
MYIEDKTGTYSSDQSILRTVLGQPGYFEQVPICPFCACNVLDNGVASGQLPGRLAELAMRQQDPVALVSACSSNLLMFHSLV